MDLTSLPIYIFIVCGFVAQIIDGALGMAYGVSLNTLLLSFGIPPASASASIHLSEVITTGISGLSHWRLGNIDKKLIINLAIPGVLGGIAGAYLLTSFEGSVLKPYISGYLLLMGVVILVKAFGKTHEVKRVFNRFTLSILGTIGGILDALGGGGWGPVVTTTLVARGNHPRYSIGSVNASEFFVTFAESLTFLLTLTTIQWKAVVGLLIGGAIAAPFAAILTRKLPVRFLMAMVGVLIILLSIRTIVMAIQ